MDASIRSAAVGPAGLPKSIIAALNQEINKYTISPEGKTKLASLGLTPLPGTPA